MTRIPAHPGKEPLALQFSTLHGTRAMPLIRATGAALVERALHPTFFPLGYYRLSGGQLSKPVFAKILAAEQMAREALACDLANRAASAGLPALHSMGKTSALDDTHYLMCWPWVDAHFYKGTTAELSNLGAALRRLHDFLRQQMTPEWETRGRRALDTAWQSFENLVQATPLEAHIASALRQLLQDRQGVDCLLADQAQPLHNDLHRGNVLFDDRGRVFAFLDFEEAIDSFASPWLDVSWVVERFCVESQARITRQKIEKVLTTYRPAGLKDMQCKIGNRLKVLGLWRNLHSLALLHRMPIRSPHWRREWKKFSHNVGFLMLTSDENGL
jgi:Ser/Thr protein kinase RdoA (MazF antagonist)